MRDLAAGTAMMLLLISVAEAADGPPRRVVSMNVCTDQLAMLVAAEGQLHSVSYLASDPATSVLAGAAGAYVVNHSLAEEIFLMKPDLVVAGTYSTRATVGLLRRIGIRVEEFAPEQSLDDVRSNIARMGEILGRPERANELVAELDRQLTRLNDKGPSGQVVATYYANSYSSGAGTLVDAVIKASGLTNLAASIGLTGTAKLPLEVLVLSRPDLLADGEAGYATPALAGETFAHPAYRALAEDTASVAVPAKYTICGAPFTAEAARIMRDAADAAAEGSK